MAGAMHDADMDMGMGMGMMTPPSPSSMPAGGDMTMMHMTFFWGHNVDILFSGWPGDRGVGMYVLALFVVFVTSVLVEFLHYVPFLFKQDRGVSKGLVLTVLAAARTGMSYLVMLAVMSFNVGVLIVAVAGHALGFFIFGSGVFKQPASDQSTVLPSAKC